MSWKRFLPVAVALLMALPTVLVVSPAALAQETVPIAPSVPWQPVVNHVTKLHVRFDNLGPAAANQPDCQAGHLRLGPASSPANRPRATCTFSATGAGEVSTSRAFDYWGESDAVVLPNRDILVVGNESFRYVHSGFVSEGVTVTAEVRTDGTPIARGSFVSTDPTEDSYSIFLPLLDNAGSKTILANRTLQLVVSAQARADVTDPTNAVIDAPTWEIADTGTRLEMMSTNALRSATWVADERSDVKDLFRPLPKEAAAGSRIAGFFALQSALGKDDARTAGAPRFSLVLDGTPVEIGAGGATSLDGFRNVTASQDSSGTSVWSTPVGTIDYRGLAPGEYSLRVAATHHQGASVGVGVERLVRLTSQSVSLKPYADDAAGFLESQAHSVQPGGSTTYVLVLNNTGSANDTFEITLAAPNGAVGWSAAVGGPGVEARRVTLAPGQEKLVTVTVSAPFNAPLQSQAIHLVNATSVLDPAARSLDLTLVSTASDEVRRDLGVIVLERDLVLDPGVPQSYAVYVWNRGTRPQNVSLDTDEVEVQDWKVDLLSGATPVDRLTLANVPPGGVAEATLRVQGPVSSTFTRHEVTLNATSLDANGISVEKLLAFSLSSPSGVRIQVLDKIGSAGHIAEVSGNATLNTVRCAQPSDDTCDDDGVDGLWYRVWVTNTGKGAEGFTLSADSYAWAADDLCGTESDEDEAFRPRQLGDGLAFYFRTPTGSFTGPVTAVPELKAGETAEVYLWRPVVRDVDLCPDDPRDGDGRSDDFFSLVIQAQGATTGALARYGLDAVARNEDDAANRQSVVLLEPVERDENYVTKPVVDVSRAGRTSIVGGIRPGENTTYYVRVTNGASWSTYLDDRGRRVSPDIRVWADGVAVDEGWNVSIRPVRDTRDETVHPFVKEFWLHNDDRNNGRREAFIDDEIEVVVRAPAVANGTALAGAQDQFTLNAGINGTASVSLEIKTVVTEFADVKLETPEPTLFAHAGEPAPYLAYVLNNGSAATSVTLRASIVPEESSNNGVGWRVEPSSVTFPLAAFKNRTVALLVTPPPGSPAGARGVVNVTAEYAEAPSLDPSVTKNDTKRITTDVVARDALRLTPGPSQATVGPGGFANFTMTVKNEASGQRAVQFQATTTPIPNWTVTLSPSSGILQAGESRTLVLLMRAPTDVVNQSRFSNVVRVEEVDAANNFDAAAFTVDILGGKAIPSISVPLQQKTVDRAGEQTFEVLVSNVGTTKGRFPLAARSADPAWVVGIRDAAGNNVTSVELEPNQLTTLNVTVRAPFAVPERTLVPIEVTAASQDLTQAAKATMQALIHDYGVQLRVTPSQVDAMPGVPLELTLKLRNTGNDNDTLNVTSLLRDVQELRDWSVDFSADEVLLGPGQEADVRATVRMPTSPLPAARSYTLRFLTASQGGADVSILRNETALATIVIPSYRSLDVDRDGSLEVAVDVDRRSSNGYEVFREISPDGVQSVVVADSVLDGKTRFFLDVPGDRSYDGVADVWFDPESVYAYRIEHSPDLNDDGTPDYLLDTDRDGKVDRGFDSVTERYWTATEVKIFGDSRVQYLVDTRGDGKFDRFYDPERDVVTRTEQATKIGPKVVGVDTDDDGEVDRYYDVEAERATAASVGNFADFTKKYYYFFIAFALVALVSVALLVMRMRRRD